MRVDTIRSVTGDRTVTAPTQRGTADIASPSFGDELKSMVKAVNQRDIKADQLMTASAAEGPNKIHETMIQLEEADLSTRLFLKVRGKALEAYQEIMRMQF